jgi:predicted TIM-barrel fold metal-dependent hydrolase
VSREPFLQHREVLDEGSDLGPDASCEFFAHYKGQAENALYGSFCKYLHPRASHNAVMYDNHPELTGANWGFAPETATHALRILYGGIFDRYPTAKLVLGHLGESLPFLAWRIQHGINFSPNGRFTKKRLADYLAENIWVTTSGNFNTQALHCAILTMGSDRILFSNDYPYEDYAEGGEFIDTVPISESDRRKIAYDNAKALYKL